MQQFAEFMNADVDDRRILEPFLVRSDEE